VVIDLDNDSKGSKKQKENSINLNNHLYDTDHHQFRTPSTKIGVHNNRIEWKSATKAETAELIRKLYLNSATDYNFEYRKKKFFENFMVTG
jgi:hypothetical protein